ncbi:transposase [Corynebacterium choanae]|uniref:transposase n=1 Tax=Corynebacterium choanae TaxID=1862358 RepID=UPI00248283DD|nr:transposase [Corynebacterium choanae]
MASTGMSTVEIAAELGVSEATLYNWRKKYNGMDTKGYDKSSRPLNDENATLGAYRR